MPQPSFFLSIVVPAYNEAHGLPDFHAHLIKSLEAIPHAHFEILYCDDGSTDQTAELVRNWIVKDKRIKLIKLSRNFGKESALTAGIHMAGGDAIILIDADGQHPVELIPEFIARWQAGSRVVIGVRTENFQEGFVKHFGSRLFYAILNRLTGMKLVPNSTDFRLIDQVVQHDFMRMTERNRITRGLIDWLGYERDYLPFKAQPRLNDKAGYSFRKLLKLAVDSIISLSISPLYITAYAGIIVLPVSVFLALMIIADSLLGDPLHWRVTGGAYVMVLILFISGLLLMSQSIIGLYLSHIHAETQNRPLYVIDRAQSSGIPDA